MLPETHYEALRNFSGLPLARKICAEREQGFLVTDFPLLEIPANLQEEDALGLRFRKSQVLQQSTPTVASALAVMRKLHSLAQPILHNLSHALELPWEKYLSDMHEFHVSGQDELQIVAAEDSIPQEWSTLTIVLSLDNPSEMSVVFGEALSVFSDGTIPEPSSPVLTAGQLPKQTGRGWIVYHLRPSDDVLYTRTAGALMRPLSTSEYETVPRVRDLHDVLLKGTA